MLVGVSLIAIGALGIYESREAELAHKRLKEAKYYFTIIYELILLYLEMVANPCKRILTRSAWTRRWPHFLAAL